MAEAGDAESATSRKIGNEDDGALKGSADKPVDVSSGSDGSKAEKVQDEGSEKKPSMVKKIWGKIGLDIGTVMMMFKGSVAPIIAVAFYQADSVSLSFIDFHGWQSPGCFALGIKSTPSNTPAGCFHLYNSWLPRPYHLGPFNSDNASRKVFTNLGPEYNCYLHRVSRCSFGNLEWNPSSQTHHSCRIDGSI